MLRDLELEQAELRKTFLRISVAIQVIEEMPVEDGAPNVRGDRMESGVG